MQFPFTVPDQLPVWVIDIAVCFTLLEGLVLQHRARRIRREGGVAPFVWADLAAGVALMLAARTALTGGEPLKMVACLVLALGAHLIDLRARWRRR